MTYIEINGEKYECEVDSFHTQLGSQAIRIKGAPLAENGFKLYNDDELIADMSDYKYLYREDGTIKEYTKVAEEIIPASGYVSGIPESPIQRQFDSINRRITSITPYEQTKTAYHGEIEKVFYGVPNGVMNVLCPTPYTATRIEDRVTIKFNSRLTDQIDITITVQ